MGRVTKETYSSGLPGDEGISVESTYDRDGNRIRLTSSLGADILQKYDYRGNVSEIEALNAEYHESWKAEIKRNELGLEIEKSLTGNVAISRRYDEFGRPITMSVNQGRSSRQKEMYNRRYIWNATDQLMSVLNGITGGYVHYAYDAIGNLASAQYSDGSYEYKMPDAMGNVYRNKDHSDREYGAGGRLLRDKQYNYFYDGEGNLTLKTKRRTPGIASLDYIPPRRWGRDEDTTYVPPKQYTDDEKKALLAQWEEERKYPQWGLGSYAYSWYGNGMLKSVKLPDSNVVAFEYDALGRRTAKVFKDEINRYLWDGNVLLHEWKYDKAERPRAITDEHGVSVMKNPEPTPDVVIWVYEEGTFVPSAKLVNNDRFSIVSDHLGRPVQAYSDTGELVWQTDYNIYGGLRNLKGERGFLPFRMQGMYADSELDGLYYNRFRWYDSNTGNYLSQDPIGLAGNNPTLYGYVQNSNVMTDILGLKGAVTAILEIGGKQYKGISQTLFKDLEDSAFKDLVQDSLDEVKNEFDKMGKKVPEFMGNCAELNAIKQALDDNLSLSDLKGGKFIDIYETKTGKYKSPCECCQKILDKLGITDVHGEKIKGILCK